MTPLRRLLVVSLLVAAAATASGPPGRLVVALLLLLLGPGFLLRRVLLREREPPLIGLAGALGLSLSLWPLLYQWLTIAGLALLTPVLALLVGGIGFAALLLLWRDDGPPAPVVPRSEPRWANAALVAICGLALWARFAEIESLALPAWVDSVHHALMVRVAAERGQAPMNLTPYMPIGGLPYHWGYHVLIGAAMQLSGLPVDKVLLWSGQILNALHAPAAAALALALWRRPVAALVAALVVGLVSTMPAYYVSWGRYTQLTGLLMLPALVIFWRQSLAHNSWRTWAATAIVLAGMSLVHFRVLIFSLTLLAALSLLWAVQHGLGPALSRLRMAALCAVAALALAGPWLVLIAQRTLLPAIERPQNLVIDGGYNALRPELLWVGQNPTLIGLALLAALWGCWQRKPVAIALLAWVAALMVMANPTLITFIAPAVGAVLIMLGAEGLLALATRAPLPSSGRAAWAVRSLLWVGLGLGLLLINPWRVRIPAIYLITFDAVLISLFLPMALLIGGAAAALYERLVVATAGPRRALAEASVVLLVGGVALWGGNELRDVINQATVIATAPDVAALEWVAQHTPPNARFLINAAPWIGGTDRGVDGGWWILPLTGRWTSTPPALFIYGPLAYVAEVQARNRTVIDYRPGGEQAIRELIAREKIGYLYFGPEGGPLKAETFANLPGFTTVYKQDGVVILAVDS